MVTEKLKSLTRGLTTNEIDSMLKGNTVTRNHYIGTFPSCFIPNSDKNIYCFITNTDDHDGSGQHWNSWFVRGERITFFDSFGRKYDNENFPKHYLDIVEQFDYVEYTTKRVQDWSAKTCGFYCLHFSFLLSLGLDIRSFLKDYSLDYMKNDKIVLDIVDSLF